jgi:hypothetical protein
MSLAVAVFATAGAVGRSGRRGGLLNLYRT